MRMLPFGDATAQRAAIPSVVRHLEAGGLIVYPTETVFGIGGTARPDAVRALAALKRRSDVKPFILLVSDVAQAPGLHWNEDARHLADAFWPGPLTLVLADPDSRYPLGVRSADGGVALRLTPHDGIRRLIGALGQPITSSSANAPGERPATTATQARDAVIALAGEDTGIVLLDGEAGGAAPSTVVDCTRQPPRLVRAGAVPSERIREVVHDVEG